MRNPLSETIVNIKPSGIRKFFDLVSEMNDKDVISLGVGEPDFDTPWHVRDEGIYSLEKGRTFYTSNSGLKELREEICNYLDRRYQVSYDWHHETIVTVGGSEGIDIAMRAMLDPGDEVLIPQPSYVSYEPCAILAGGKPVIIELKAENEFRLTPEELLRMYPVEKKFNGTRWNEKDYFYTMDKLRCWPADQPLGGANDVACLLWDYQNWDLDEVLIEWMHVLGDLRIYCNDPAPDEEFHRKMEKARLSNGKK